MNRIKKILLIVLMFYINKIVAQDFIWKQTNGPLGGTIGDMSINSSGDIYAGVFGYWNDYDSYTGLYKSTDNGNRWSRIKTNLEDFEVYAIFFTEDNHIWVGTTYKQRIYFSSDNGQTWTIKNNGYNTGECWAFGRSKTGVMFAGDGKFRKTFRSTNYGESWELTAHFGSVVFATDSNNNVYAGTLNGLFVSQDNGITWIKDNFFGDIPVSTIIIDSANGVYCGTGYFYNGDGVFYSNNGGQSWRQIGLGGKIVLSLAFDSNGYLYAGTFSDGLFKTTNQGATWTQHNNGIEGMQVFRLKIDNNDNIFLGTENEGIFKSTDSGNSFRQIGLPISRVDDLVFDGDSLIFTATPSGVQKYNVFTKIWSNLGLRKVTALSFTSSNVLIASTYNYGLYTSTDLGATWRYTNLTRDTMLLIYNTIAISDSIIFAATNRNLRKSTDLGHSWSITPIFNHLSASAIFYNDNNLFVVGGSSSPNVSLFKSSDLGVSFIPILSGFSLQQVNKILSVTQNDYIFLGTSHSMGLMRSSNLGNNWSQMNLNINYPKSVFADEDGNVIVSEVDNYYSSDFGDSWITIPHPLTEKPAYVSIVRKNMGKYYVGTFGDGLYELDLPVNINDKFEIPDEFILYQNYPNPFSATGSSASGGNPSTTISWQSAVGSRQSIKLYDILGREIDTIVEGYFEAGKHSTFYIVNSTLPSGVYFYQLRAGDYVQTKKMILMR